MATVKIKAEPHPAQIEIHASPARFRIVSAGRRFGKTRLAVNECLEVAADGGRALWLAPTHRMADVGWNPMRQIAASIPGAVISLSNREITLPTGGIMAARTADNPQNLRGDAWDYVVMDEAAYMKREVWTEAVRPTLADRNGRALFISTPRGKNWFWEMFTRGLDLGDTQSFSYSTYANPYIDPKEIDAAKAELPELIFRQEFLAEFIDDNGGVFRNVQASATAEKLEAPEKDKTYVIGVDVAASVDYTVITVLDVSDKREVYKDRFTRCDYPVLEDRIVASSKRWGASAVIVEANSAGAAVIDHLRTRGVPVQGFWTSQSTKTEIIQKLQSAFEHGEIKIMNDPVTVAELLSFEGKRNQSGLMTYSAPDGMHDDTVMSLAIAWNAAQKSGRKVFFFGDD